MTKPPHLVVFFSVSSLRYEWSTPVSGSSASEVGIFLSVEVAKSYTTEKCEGGEPSRSRSLSPSRKSTLDMKKFEKFRPKKDSFNVSLALSASTKKPKADQDQVFPGITKIPRN